MKVFAEPLPAAADADPAPRSLDLRFSTGIVGFPEHRRGEVFHLPDQLPFQWLRLHGPSPLHFVIIDPVGLVPGYAPELFDDDATALGIGCAGDALIYNIVTVRDDPSRATVNLVGPIIVNRHTGAARQIVVANHALYSARHPLVASA